MANNKYRIREFNPSANQSASHSFYAEAVVDNVITNKELAKKIAARGLSRPAEIKAILEEAANIIYEEVSENNRVQLEAEDGILVSIFPQCQGSVSDAMVQANPEKYNGATAATADMITANMLTWSLQAQVGRNISREFGLHCTAQRVDYNPNQQAANPSGETPASQDTSTGTQDTSTNTGSGDDGLGG